MKTALIIHKIAIVFVLCLFAGTSGVCSQNQNTDWSAESYLVTANTTKVEIHSILSKQGSNFVWQQLGYNTNSSDTYTIVASSGSWDTQNHLGTLSYDLESIDQQTATLSISGTTETMTMTLSIHQAGGSDDIYLFEIDTDTLTHL
ncbi:hypothetical protein [uncultured Winogradskyella sp.]|uniref:hypothetical protein n=1 Tax=uncultured Winogradskyella sp. TaxID=395353 RepID=UPI002622000B|nr:hypothetical protein [uncultured Winogradskyella sp.]